MPRRAAVSAHFVARLRAWFGLSRGALALYLGVSTGLVQAWETGRRAPGAGLLAGLLPLLAHVPPAADGSTPAAAPNDAPVASPAPLPPAVGLPPDAGALRFRQRQCQQQAARLRAQADALARQAQIAARWAEALPALLAALPLLPAADSAEAAAHAAWQTDWLHRQARPLPPAAVARWHLLHARAAAYQAEAAALAASLASLPGAPA